MQSGSHDRYRLCGRMKLVDHQRKKAIALQESSRSLNVNLAVKQLPCPSAYTGYRDKVELSIDKAQTSNSVAVISGFRFLVAGINFSIRAVGQIQRANSHLMVIHSFNGRRTIGVDKPVEL